MSVAPLRHHLSVYDRDADVGARGPLPEGWDAGEALFIVAPGIRAELGHQRPSGAPRDDPIAVLVE
ncbi:MAG: hypothetical protein ACXVH3_30560 [Solirubrobacteraceae bacterium]